MMEAGFVYIWVYEVALEHLDAFVEHYKHDGVWARAFAKSPDHLGTMLMQDSARSTRFTTIDFWRTKQARDDFWARHRAQLDAIDQRCEAFTVSETSIGDFETPEL